MSNWAWNESPRQLGSGYLCSFESSIETLLYIYIYIYTILSYDYCSERVKNSFKVYSHIFDSTFDLK